MAPGILEDVAALARVAVEDVRFLQSPEAWAHEGSDDDLAEEAAEIPEAEVLGELREACKILFLSRPRILSRLFALARHGLSLTCLLTRPPKGSGDALARDRTGKVGRRQRCSRRGTRNLGMWNMGTMLWVKRGSSIEVGPAGGG